MNTRFRTTRRGEIDSENPFDVESVPHLRHTPTRRMYLIVSWRD